MNNDFFKDLSSEEYEIIANKGTEAPFSGEYNDHYEPGFFICRACSNKLYESNTKFNSGCGWPSFDDEVEGAIVRYEDKSLDRVRTEICCANCDGHLGHVFHGEKITEKDTRHCVNSLSIRFVACKNLNKATFGAGCFWKVQKIFADLNGVYDTSVGYMGGITNSPTYDEVCTGKTNHAEVVQITYNPKEIKFENLLSTFWENHNPTTLNQQGNDSGTQYRSVIFFHSTDQKDLAQQSKKEFQKKVNEVIVTEIIEKKDFFRAEEYHQNYLNKNNLGLCNI